VDKHVTAVAVIHIGFGALGMLAAIFVFLAVAGAGFLSGDLQAIFVTSTVATVVGAFLAVTSLPSIIGGVGLLQRRDWARILVLIVAVFHLLNVPVGTAVAVYTFWVLLQDETRALFQPRYG
jgi:hypothetical protein